MLNNASYFLINTIFDIYIFILLLRIVLQWKGANYYNPICQALVKLTDPVVKPLQKLIPNMAGFNVAGIVIIILLTLIKFLLISAIKIHGLANPLGLLVWSVGDILNSVINLFFYAILFKVILSWINQGRHHPINDILELLTGFILHPAQRLIPTIAGIDISPIPVMIVLQLLVIMLVKPIEGYGIALTFNML